MADKIISSEKGYPTRLRDMGDGTFAEVIYSANGGGGSGSSGLDRELVVSTYRCKTAFTGASVGDTITATQVIDVSGATPSTVGTIWRNQTTAADLASAPSAANLELTGSTALTDTQLRATAVPVSLASAPLPSGAATAANQAAGNTSLSSIDGKLPSLSSGRMPVSSSVPTTGSGTILSLTTAATGSTYTAFAAQACIALDIVNNTGTTIEYRRGATGTAMQIPTGAARMVIGITNANQIDIRRTDASNTQVTLQAEAFTA